MALCVTTLTEQNTMSNGLQNGWIGGGYFYLLQAPFGAAVAKKASPVCTVLVWCRSGCGTGAKLVAAFAEWQRCQYNALMMHCTLNSLINTINDNYF